MKTALVWFFLCLLAGRAEAQWQTPNHSVPQGRGAGITGFGSAGPGATNLPFVGNGAAADGSFRVLPNAGLASAPATTMKCNPTAGIAVVQDCTFAQFISLTQPVNTFVLSHTIDPTDCNGDVQMGTGATTQKTLALPSVSGFTAPCRIRVINGNTYSPGVSGGMLMSGFPPGVFYILFPGQSFDIKLSGGVWVVDRTSGRWMQAGPELYAVNGGSDTLNDCMSPTTGCASINQVANGILMPRIDNLNGSPIIHLHGAGTWNECVVLAGQLVGVNVGFIEGTGGQAIWNTSGACAALLIGDNAEWETQNITYSSPTPGGSGIFVHQPGVVDMLSGTNFGAFSGGRAIGSDHGGFINFDQGGGNVAIGPGAIGTFLDLGQGTQMTGSFTALFVGSPTLGTWMTISGAGTNAILAAIAVSGAATVGVSTCRGPSAFTLGASLPGGAPTATLGCQSL